MKNAFGSLISRPDTAEERCFELENIIDKILKNWKTKLFFFLWFYPFIWQREHKQGAWKGVGEAGFPMSRQSDEELGPRSLGSGPEPDA